MGWHRARGAGGTGLRIGRALPWHVVSLPIRHQCLQGRPEGSAWRLSGVQPADTSVQSSGLGPRPLPHLATSLPSLFLTFLFLSPSVSFSFFAGSNNWERLSPKSQVRTSGVILQATCRGGRTPETGPGEPGRWRLTFSLTCLSSLPSSLTPSPRSTSPPQPLTSSSPAPPETSSVPAMCLAASGKKTKVCLRTSCGRSPCTGEARGLSRMWLWPCSV